MKRNYVLLAVVIALTVSCASMQMIKPEEGIYSETVQVPRMNAADLFKTVNLWLSNHFAEQQRSYQSGGLTLFDQPIQSIEVYKDVNLLVAVRKPALEWLIIPPSVVDVSNEGQGLIGGEYTFAYRDIILKDAEIIFCISANFSVEVKDEEYTITFSNPYHRRHGGFNRDSMKIGKPISVVIPDKDGTPSGGLGRKYLEPTRLEWETLATGLKNFVVGN
jgi:hypothetical protein